MRLSDWVGGHDRRGGIVGGIRTGRQATAAIPFAASPFELVVVQKVSSAPFSRTRKAFATRNVSAVDRVTYISQSRSDRYSRNPRRRLTLLNARLCPKREK